MSFDTRERLELAVKMMQVLDGRRTSTGDQNLGSNIERMIVGRELEEIESEILNDPGALAPYVTPVRRRAGDQND